MNAAELRGILRDEIAALMEQSHASTKDFAARYGTRQFREKARLGAFQSGVQLLAPLFGLCFDSRPGGSIGRRILFLSEQIEKSHNKIGFSPEQRREELNAGLERTKTGLFSKLARAVAGRSTVDAEVLDDLEEVLIT